MRIEFKAKVQHSKTKWKSLGKERWCKAYDEFSHSVCVVFCSETGLQSLSCLTDLYKPDGTTDVLPVFLQVTCIRCILATAAASAGQGVLGHWGEYFSSLYPLGDRLVWWTIWWKLICCLHGTVNRQIWFGDVIAWIWLDRWLDFTVSGSHSCRDARLKNALPKRIWH